MSSRILSSCTLMLNSTANYPKDYNRRHLNSTAHYPKDCNRRHLNSTAHYPKDFNRRHLMQYKETYFFKDSHQLGLDTNRIHII